MMNLEPLIIPRCPRILSIGTNLMQPALRFAIVVARFNSVITEKLLEGAQSALAKAQVEIFRVPGAFELPLAAKMLAQTHHYHGIVALGAVIRGDTPHFDYVAGRPRGACRMSRCKQEFRSLSESSPPILWRRPNRERVEKTATKASTQAMTVLEMAHFAISVAR